MDRIWQWAWDRHGARYSWVVGAVLYLAFLPIWFGTALIIVAFEDSHRYVEAAAVAVVGVTALVYVTMLPGLSGLRLVERWAAGDKDDVATALEATYTTARRGLIPGLAADAVWGVLLAVSVGAIAGAPGSRLVQYGIVGAVVGTTIPLPGVHSFMEGALRPVRVAIAGDTGIGDALPRSQPTFAAWSSLAMLAVAFNFAVAGAWLAAVFDRTSEMPVLVVVIGCALALGLGVPITVGAAFAPSLHPIRDLAEGTERVAAGDLQPTPAGGSGR